jgi:EF-P beta-lysylation protein EpmB
VNPDVCGSGHEAPKFSLGSLPAGDERLFSGSTPVSSIGISANSWQRDLAGAVRDRSVLLSRLGLSDTAVLTPGTLQGETSPDETLRESAAMPDFPDFPLLVPESFLARMQPGNPRDPLLLQVLPQPNELMSHPGFVADAVGDLSARRAPGMLHKYAGRALLIASGACAIHCRYCFRREYPYSDDPRRFEDWNPTIQEIEGDSSLHEVILSGGDPLMLNDDLLERLCRRLEEIPHLERIRLHTRLPIVLPSRVTTELLKVLTNLRTQTIFVVHANHPAEIAADCADALRLLVRAGLPVLNQAVLLKGINDSAEVLEQLSRRLINLGVMPYYLHQLDRVQGTAHFEVTEAQGRELVQALSARLPGYAVPRYVREIPGESSKTPL